MVFVQLPVQTYQVCEVAQDGWLVTTPGGACQEVTILAEDEVMLHFGNTEAPEADVSVVKSTSAYYVYPGQEVY